MARPLRRSSVIVDRRYVRFQPFERAEGPLAGRRRYRQRDEDVKEPGDDWE